MSPTFETFDQEFLTRVAGVTYVNQDGTDRQALLRACSPGQPVHLRREPDNPHDKFAIAVALKSGHVIGYIPAGDSRLAEHIDRGGQIAATILSITGGRTWLQRLLGIKGKSYGCVIKIAKGDFDWSTVSPWMAADREIDNLIKSAKRREKNAPNAAVRQYRDAIQKIMALDSNGPTAAAWRTARYPINRLSLALHRQGKEEEALFEIQRWESYPDAVGISDADRQSVNKRKLRLGKSST
jgi:hypothetical protein